MFKKKIWHPRKVTREYLELNKWKYMGRKFFPGSRIIFMFADPMAGDVMTMGKANKLQKTRDGKK